LAVRRRKKDTTAALAARIVSHATLDALGIGIMASFASCAPEEWFRISHRYSPPSWKKRRVSWDFEL
jgi:hypothetical protein